MPVEKRGGLGSLWGVHCEDLLSNGGAVGQECEGFLVLVTVHGFSVNVSHYASIISV